MKTKFNNREEALGYIETLPLNEIKNLLCDYLLKENPDRIILSEEQFAAFFKIRGIAEDGSRETRGRKKKETFVEIK